ncbi:aminotransferase class I/II-fold pyridoxal phosphate-dependent enzyme [Coxiella endosymbiont of Amblyomma nuttalli]|uniref:aminotransferase class I/II-fold pyridoxal phosphate-dependent enzyme n=1 Tax=Coxiella endosymbiont of Amblyomma nuttalli TaxID=2749996 RepID=UPI001FD5C3AB|nr:8-amino-7-oxononanoate synthase [Coxiella endosymbiont of Amblyomma nuttalli]
MQDGLLRRQVIISERKDNWIKVNGESCINFCSNDYLGLASHPAVKESLMKGIQKYGAGSASSALIAGYFESQQELEKKFAAFLNRDQAVFFSSGYMANLGTITSLLNRESVVVSDKLCHASLLDAIQLSKAKHYRYRHNDLAHFKFLLHAKKPDFIVTEGNFSMEGDLAILPSMIKLFTTIPAILIVDDAHGIGVLGKNGGGSSDYWGLSQAEVPCLIASLGKAFGCAGAMVSGQRDLMEAVLQFSKTYRNTTALPPAISSAALKSLEIIQTESWRRDWLNEIIQFFIHQAHEKGLVLISTEITPIKCLLVADNKKTQIIQKKMMEKGFFISCIRPPSVPEKTARIRISFNCFHTKEQISQLVQQLALLLC